MNLHRLRVAILSIVISATCLFVLLATTKIFLTVLAFFIPSLTTTLFDSGALGLFYPIYYSSFNLSSPFLAPIRWDDQCDDGSYILLTPKGEVVPHPGPMILDAKGNLIWNSNSFRDVTNLQVQQYNDQPFLTFWSGEKTGSQGKGLYHMLDSSYDIAYTIRAVGHDLQADLHEFKVTPEGTALFTVYNKTTMDISDIGRPNPGWISDSIFQEVDIATNDLLFQWRASDHWYASEGYWPDGIGGWFGGYHSYKSFDFFHINSVDKDSKGNYLISSRHMHCIISITPNGTTEWVLGGKRNEFTDLSNGRALDFKWQHDARWVQEPSEANDQVGILTLFDNQEGGILHTDGPFSKGMMLRVDLTSRTVQLLHEYVSVQRTRSPSQGSTQVLPNGNVLVGWGHSAGLTEFTKDGEILCEWHFGASWWNWWGAVTSYRAQKIRKEEWVGNPIPKPGAVVRAGRLWVSWNGATEVEAWKLEGWTDEAEIPGFLEKFRKNEDGWYELDALTKERFEESFELNPYERKFEKYRVAAVDRKGQVLDYSIDLRDERIPRWIKVVMWLTFTLGILVGLAICLFGWRWWSRGTELGWSWSWPQQQRWRWPRKFDRSTRNGEQYNKYEYQRLARVESATSASDSRGR